MIPEREFLNKLDTETIYSFLNQYQDKFIHDIYKALDNIPSPSKPSAYVETILHGLLAKHSENVDQHDGRVYHFTLPTDFGLYLNSTTIVTSTYRYKADQDTDSSGNIPNQLIAQSKANEFLSKPYDKLRILRVPVAYLDKLEDGTRCISVIYDNHTDPQTFNLSYYKVPAYMDLMTSTPCELPMDAFDDLVTGAVDLYVQYVAGAEANKRRQEEAARQQAKQQRNNED